MGLITGIHHAALRCCSEEEMKRTAKFYCDTLGMQLVDACVERCHEKGLMVTQEPVDLVVPSEQSYPIRIAFVIGIAGEIIEFFSEQ